MISANKTGVVCAQCFSLTHRGIRTQCRHNDLNLVLVDFPADNGCKNSRETEEREYCEGDFHSFDKHRVRGRSDVDLAHEQGEKQQDQSKTECLAN